MSNPDRPAARVLAVGAAVVVAVLVMVVSIVVLVNRRDSELASTADEPTATRSQRCGPDTPEEIPVTVEATLPHATDAYTQGLVVADGDLFESTGRVGESTLRRLDPQTGEQRQRVDLPVDVFAEGLAVGKDGELVQLTWRDGIAFRWDRGGLDPTGRFDYDGEGWGLTTLDDGTLLMSDGSDILTERDPTDFSVLERRRLTRSDGPADELNELEWDGTHLWANRYRSDELLRIDPDCATVTGVADLGELRADAEAVAERDGTPIDVPNGIAHLPGGEGYLVTGKWWPTMYRVRLGGR